MQTKRQIQYIFIAMEVEQFQESKDTMENVAEKKALGI